MIETCMVAVALILADVLTGLASAAKSKTLSSSVMRDGLFKKLGELMLLGLAVFVHFILDVKPFTDLGIPPEIAYSVVGYIALMEILSIIENICVINPDLAVSRLLHMFNLDVDDKQDR